MSKGMLLGGGKKGNEKEMKTEARKTIKASKKQLR